MKTFARVLLAGFSVCLLLVLTAAGWCFFYTGDLPDVEALHAAAPQTHTRATQDICGQQYTGEVIPAKELSPFVLAAFRAEEERRGTTRLAWYLARTLDCKPSRILTRIAREYRIKTHINRQFDTDELELITLNRIYFGDETFGIENASQHYFQKPASQLSAGEAAFLVGLIQSPSRFSPTRHPDRAVERRNYVLDEMVSRGWLTPSDAQREKSLPLGIAKS
jgi:membrane carboxypeptidase/penicillin-binding protein